MSSSWSISRGFRQNVGPAVSFRLYALSALVQSTPWHGSDVGVDTVDVVYVVHAVYGVIVEAVSVMVNAVYAVIAVYVVIVVYAVIDRGETWMRCLWNSDK